MKNKTNVRTLIRKIVREEVAMAIQEVITELKQPTKRVSQPKQKVNEKKSFSKNSVLNDVLNETAVSSPPISSDNSTYPNMENKVYTTDDMSTMMNGGDKTISVDGQTPDFLQKDFKSILDKSIQKSNQKQGM